MSNARERFLRKNLSLSLDTIYQYRHRRASLAICKFDVYAKVHINTALPSGELSFCMNELQTGTIDVTSIALDYLTPTGRRRVVRQPKCDLERTDVAVPFRGGHIATRSWGSGPVILLVHGWSGDQSDMFAYVPVLTSQGYRVITLDLPAHGDSSGDFASIQELSAGILAVVAHLGLDRETRALGHSIGCAALTLAISRGLELSRLAFLAPPESYEKFARLFGASRGLNDEQIELMLQSLTEDLGIEVKLVTSEISATFTMPGLVIHSSDDTVTPVSNSHKIAANWRDCTLLEVSDMGHRGLLKNQTIIEKVSQFFAE